ncbi:hypothetical protein C8J41_103278 [Sphingomonas sp. PP-CC-3G-468]|nr:hypothetical protein C8J41_103278 [Sphingomonas sp. PP-CC-3G-468]
MPGRLCMEGKPCVRCPEARHGLLDERDGCRGCARTTGIKRERSQPRSCSRCGSWRPDLRGTTRPSPAARPIIRRRRYPEPAGTRGRVSAGGGRRSRWCGPPASAAIPRPRGPRPDSRFPTTPVPPPCIVSGVVPGRPGSDPSNGATATRPRSSRLVDGVERSQTRRQRLRTSRRHRTSQPVVHKSADRFRPVEAPAVVLDR